MGVDEPLPILRRLTDVIEDRRQRRPADSYTAQLLDRGAPAVAAKLREEAEELIEAALDEVPDCRQVVHEAADLLFHTMVLLAQCGLRLEDIEAELERRFGTSGLTEKPERTQNGTRE